MASSLPTLTLRFSTPTIVPVIGGGGVDLDLLAADLPQQVGQRRVRRQVDGERLERLGDRVLAAVVDGGDLAAAEVLQDHALEQVVDVVDVELQIDVAIPFDLAVVLEEAHAGAEQHHPLQRQVAGLLVGGKSALHCRRADRELRRHKRQDKKR